MKDIKSLSIVTSIGVSSYTIGYKGVTLIEETGKRISNDNVINIFRVYKGDELCAEISQSCPYEVVYKGGEKKSKSNE